MSTMTSAAALWPNTSQRDGTIYAFRVPGPESDPGTTPSLTHKATLLANPKVTPLSTQTVTQAASTKTIRSQTASVSMVKNTSVLQAKS